VGSRSCRPESPRRWRPARKSFTAPGAPPTGVGRCTSG
jgi:hypothetical protein